VVIRRLTGLLLTARVPLSAVLAGAGQAEAGGYRHWAFWGRDGGPVTYATEGPSTAPPGYGGGQGLPSSGTEAAGCADKPSRPGAGRPQAGRAGPRLRPRRRRPVRRDPARGAHGLRPGRRERDDRAGPGRRGQAAALRHQRPAVRHRGLPEVGLRGTGLGHG